MSRAVARLGLAGALILLSALPAAAQGSGLFIAGSSGRPLCTSITTPVDGQTFCLLGASLSVWNGTLAAYIPVLQAGTGTAGLIDASGIVSSTVSASGLMSLSLGTASIPSVTYGPLAFFDKTYTLASSSCINAIDPNCGATVRIAAYAPSASNRQQVTGLFAFARNGSTGGGGLNGGDAVALYGTAQAETGSNAFGAFLQARRTSSGAALRGAEVQQDNQANVDCTVDATGGNCVSAWLTGNSLNVRLVGVGAAVRSSAAASATFQVGFMCTNLSIGAAGLGCLDDESAAPSSIRIAGSHTFGINTIFSTLTGAALAMANSQGLSWGSGASPTSVNSSDATGVVTVTWANGGVGTTPTLRLIGQGGTFTGTSATYTMCKTGACATSCTIITTGGLITGGTCTP